MYDYGGKDEHPRVLLTAQTPIDTYASLGNLHYS